MGNDGVVVIGTTLDTKQLEKQLKEQESQLKKYEREAEKLTTTKVKMEGDLEPYLKSAKELDNEIEQLQKKIEIAKKTYNELTNMNVAEWKSLTPEEQEDVRLEKAGRFEALQEYDEELKALQEQKRTLEDIPPAVQKQLDKYNEVNKASQENARNQAVIRGEIEKTNEELGRAKGFGSIKKMLDDVGKQTEKNIKKVGKWALALFGIRAMYGFIRNSINIIAEGDEQLKADIDYMKTALAYTFEPIIRKIIELIKQLMQYLGYIIYMWTGKDIFANANKHLKSASKSAKELKKQLAGFDEANVLSDNKSGGGTGTPSFKLGGYEDMKPPTWLQWIVDHSKEILAILSGITLALTLMKLGIDWITASGFGLLIAGVVYAVASLIDYLNDPSWSNFGEIIIGIGVALTAVGLIFGAWPVLLGGVCLAIVGIVIKYWDKIKEKLDEGVKWLEDKSDWVHQMFGDEIGDLYDFIVDMIKKTIDWFDYIFNAMKGVLDGIIQFVQGVFEGNWKKALNGIIKIGENAFKLMYAPIKLIFDGILSFIGLIKERAKSIINWMIDGINKMINGLNKIKIDKPSWLGGGQWGINIPTIPKLATGGIVDMPGKGVMMGSYVAGESGREGVLPLSNPTTMAELGEAIGKWVNIAIDNRMVVDGRVLATATNNQINKENFLMNR